MTPLTATGKVWIAVSPKRVWEAITQPEQLEAWYAPGCLWEMPVLEQGAQVKFHNSETDIQAASIVQFEEARQFVLRWEPHSEYPQATLITSFMLMSENGGTSFTLSESGYETLPEDVRQPMYEQTRDAYQSILEGLKITLEREIAEASP